MQAKFGTFNTGTGAAASTVVINDVGFLPKVIFIWTNGTTNGANNITRQTYAFSFGVAITTSDRRCVAIMSQDLAAAAVAKKAQRSDACICILDNTGAVVGLMDLQSMDSGGFTLVVDDAFPASVVCDYLAIGGVDIQNVSSLQFQEAGATGNTDITTVGYRGDFFLFFGVGSATAPNDTGADSTFFIGAAVPPNLPKQALQQFVCMGGSNDGATTMQTEHYSYGGECIGLYTANVGSPDGRAIFVDSLSNGFTLNWPERTGTRYIHCVAIKGGAFSINEFLSSTVLNTQNAITTGFPVAGGLIVGATNTVSVQDTSTATHQICIGGFTSETERGAQGISDRDNIADAQVYNTLYTDEVGVNISSTTGALVGLIDIHSKQSHGYTIIQDDGDGGALTYWGIAFGTRGAFPFKRREQLLQKQSIRNKVI